MGGGFVMAIYNLKLPLLKCRYSPEVMEKVLHMAEGIDIGEMPSFELVPDAKATKRPRSLPDYSPSCSECLHFPPFHSQQNWLFNDDK